MKKAATEMQTAGPKVSGLALQQRNNVTSLLLTVTLQVFKIQKRGRKIIKVDRKWLKIGLHFKRLNGLYF